MIERTEQAGLGVAFIGHALLLAVLTFFVRPIPVPPPGPIEVSFAEDVGLFTSSPEPQAPAPAAGTAPEVGPEEEAAPAAPPEPVPAPPEPRPATKAQAPSRQAQRPAQAQPAAGRRNRSRSVLEDRNFLEGIGRDPQSTTRKQESASVMTGEARASINAAIRRALVPCERQPLPAPEAGAIKVDVRVALNRDGSLASAEIARILNNNPSLKIYERRMQDLALAIVRRCTPIRGLPAQYYDVPRGWRQFTYQFDPRQTR